MVRSVVAIEQQMRTSPKNSKRRNNPHRNRNRNNTTTTSPPLHRPNDHESLCFQDVLLQSHQEYHEDDNDDEEDSSEPAGPTAATATATSTATANCFFELANATHVTYRIDNHHNHHNVQEQPPPPVGLIKIRQDHTAACGQHTGGIVWETSYLLLNYLRQRQRQRQRRQQQQQQPPPPPPPPCHGRTTDNGNDNQEEDSFFPYDNLQTVLEVGAGCGLLGIGIYHSNMAKQVILTETELVLSNLTYNVQQNLQLHHHHHIQPPSQSQQSQQQQSQIRVCGLDWTRYKEDCRTSTLHPHSIDLIVGTDVVFSTRFVRPLLDTVRYLAHSKTLLLLCLQERCPDSHRLLLELAAAHDYGWTVRDISQQVTELPSCEWGQSLDCCILELRPGVGSVSHTHPVESARKRRKHNDDDDDDEEKCVPTGT